MDMIIYSRITDFDDFDEFYEINDIDGEEKTFFFLKFYLVSSISYQCVVTKRRVDGL